MKTLTKLALENTDDENLVILTFHDLIMNINFPVTYKSSMKSAVCHVADEFVT